VKETRQASATWRCNCPRELPVRILFCNRCGASKPKSKKEAEK
jgi:hypothetical protein